MHRDLIHHLRDWKASFRRKPLILRGARQVGKSWLARALAKEFDFYVELNLETKNQHRQIFTDDLSAERLMEKIRFVTGTPIEPGRTLLFIDEIQEVEQALLALRSFKEELPELHVIAAGSLLDFALEKVGMPVGRVQFLHVYPLSFSEFLTVQGQNALREHLSVQPIDEVLHQTLLKQLKDYFLLGGMPEVIDTWCHTKNIHECIEVQNEIVQTYVSDIPKYAKHYMFDCIEQVFNAIPHQLGNKFVYKHINSDIRSYKFKEALQCLHKAGIAHIVYHTDAQGLPLKAQINARRFKVYGFDIGLMNRLLNVEPNAWLTRPMSIKHMGNIAEQFVAQEYIAYSSLRASADLYYWHRENKTSNAEVDFLFTKNATIYPAEVKSSSKGHLKSLQLFLKTHIDSTIGLKISEAKFKQDAHLLTLPFYMIEAWIKNKDP